MSIFVETLFLMTSKCKWPKCSSTVEWINSSVVTQWNTVQQRMNKLYTQLWVNLIMLIKRSQTQCSTYCDSICINCENRQDKSMTLEVRMVVILGFKIVKGVREISGSWWCSISCSGCWLDTYIQFVKIQWPVHLRYMYYSVYLLYFNRKLKNKNVKIFILYDRFKLPSLITMSIAMNMISICCSGNIWSLTKVQIKKFKYTYAWKITIYF